MENGMWFLIESESEHQYAIERYEHIKYAEKGTAEHKELKLLVRLISEYEDRTSDLPEVDPVELIKIRMDEFGYNVKELALAYGDKGTVSKLKINLFCSQWHRKRGLSGQKTISGYA